MLTALALRSFTDLSVLHDRNPIYVTLADGSIRNGYTLRLLNKRPQERLFTLSVEGLDGARVEVAGAPGEGARAAVRVGPDTTQEARVLVFAPPARGSTGPLPSPSGSSISPRARPLQRKISSRRRRRITPRNGPPP
jgi:polyferredoxin